MKINRLKLLEALETVGRVTGKRTTLPILNCVKMDGRGGRLRIRGTDLERDVTVEIDCDGELPAVCVPMKLVAAFPQNTDAETVSIQQSQNEWIHCNGGSASAEIPPAPTKDFPPDLNDSETAIGVNAIDIAEGIEAVSWACVSNQSDFVISCVRVYSKDNKITCEACDRKTLAYFSRPVIAAEFDVLFPAQSAIAAIPFLKMDGAVLYVGENSMSVKYSGGSFSARLAKERPLTTERLLEQERQPIGIVKRSELLSALAMCKVPDVGALFQIEFQFSSSGLTLECEESGFKFKRTIPGQFAPCIIRLNVERAFNALKSLKEESLSVFLAGVPLGFRFNDQLIMIARVHKVTTPITR